MPRLLTAVALALLVAACADPVSGPAGPDRASDATAVASAGRDAPTVRIVYMVPVDRAVDGAAVKALRDAAASLQFWYQGQLGTSATFRLSAPAVEVIRTTQEADWYAGNQAGGDPALQFWFNVLDDAFALTGGGFNDPNFIWVYFVDAPQACGQVTGATSGVAVMPSNELLGLTGAATSDPCSGQVDTWGACFWTGVFGHELGHALGLPHPASCEAGAPDCPYTAIMWRGFETYPNTFLLADERAALGASAFLLPTRLPGPTPACSDPAIQAGPLAAATAGPHGALAYELSRLGVVRQ